jgi:phosphoribosyl 1,2-cyclic phosphate phosphodiesterase
MVRELEVPEACFTHVSHQMGLHRDVCDTLPPGITLAYDGMRIELR